MKPILLPAVVRQRSVLQLRLEWQRNHQRKLRECVGFQQSVRHDASTILSTSRLSGESFGYHALSYDLLMDRWNIIRERFEIHAQRA